MAKKDKRTDLLAMVPERALRILDVGCASGVLGSKLKKQGREIVGIEFDQALGKTASGRLDKVFIGDAEAVSLPYRSGYFDCILFADVLEHLRDPLALLKKLGDLVSDQGMVVASIPNIRYYKVINRLMFKGTWDYTDSGIMDRSHLRFFTLINIKELFYQAGYEIIEIQRNTVASRFLRFINVLCAGSLNDLLTYQYYIRAEKAAPGQLKPLRARVVDKF
jgi:2-polyprenyl-3-methyl-5-hydroxy-6-metoxy-1,4-benzoquinol methylase